MPQKLKKVKLSYDAVKALFETHTTQGSALDALYRLVIPDFDQVTTIENGWPSCNDRTWKRICTLFMAFDRKHHPHVFAGGCWLNSGFSTSCGEDLEDWEVSLKGVVINYWAQDPVTPAV